MDPVTLAVLKGRLESIADEMDATLFRSAFNPTIAEAHDACHGLYDATTGATLVQGKSGLPIFVGVMAFGTKSVIDKFPDVEPGDLFIFNDPYCGGTHLSDFRLIRPCFRDGALFCWLGNVGHWHDIAVAANSGVMDPITVLIAPGESAGRGSSAPGRQLHRDHPAHHRRDVQPVRPHPSGRGLRARLRHDQRALHRRATGGRAAVGDVPVLQAAAMAATRKATACPTATRRSPRPLSHRWR